MPVTAYNPSCLYCSAACAKGNHRIRLGNGVRLDQVGRRDGRERDRAHFTHIAGTVLEAPLGC